MEILARFIAVIMGIEGAVLVFFPFLGLKAARKFGDLKKLRRRLIGIIYVAVGVFFFGLTNRTLTGPVVHWVVAIFGLYLVVWGTPAVVIPGLFSNFLNWLFKEKRVTSVIGFIFFILGVALYLNV